MDASHLLSFPVTPGALRAGDVRRLVGRDDPVILDIGANWGQTTAELLVAMPRATVIAFEPDPRAIARFRQLITHPGVRLQECAVGAVNGTIRFYQSSGAEHLPQYRDGWDQSGSIRRPRTHLEVWPWVRFEQQIEVPIVTLDAWAAQHHLGDVDFIWADVQGAEGDLVEGGRAVLRRTRFFYTEYSNSEWYEGQVTLPGLAELLPDFAVLQRFPMDVLFGNRLYATPEPARK